MAAGIGAATGAEPGRDRRTPSQPTTAAATNTSISDDTLFRTWFLHHSAEAYCPCLNRVEQSRRSGRASSAVCPDIRTAEGHDNPDAVGRLLCTTCASLVLDEALGEG